MKSTIIKPVIFVVAAVVAFSASVVSAQQTGGVAILDVAKVFKAVSYTHLTLPTILLV